MNDAVLSTFKTGDIPGWEDFLACFPANWREIAKATNVLKGQRKDKEPDKLMHVLMLHLLCGYSLRETSAIAAASGIASLSDVALLKRLRKSGDMFKELCAEMLVEAKCNADFAQYRVRVVDGTLVKEPGQFGTQWRLHYSYSLSDMECDSFKITKAEGKGTGEGLEQFEINPGDIMLGARGFCRFNSIKYVAMKGGYICVRWNSGALPLYNEDGSAFDIGRFFKAHPREGMCGEASVFIHGDTPGDRLQCRVCIIRKNDESAARARRKVYRDSSKKQRTPTKLTLLACDFIVLITTLPREVFSLEKILELYRLRWQVELAFKRLKSIARIGALPKYTDSSARAWLYGKMFITLLLERISSHLGAFSPWRAVACSGGTKKFVERIQGVISHRETMDYASD